jgi:hypothetical protein
MQPIDIDLGEALNDVQDRVRALLRGGVLPDASLLPPPKP